MEFWAELHPQVVHFPIAFFLGYALLEFIGVVFKKIFILKPRICFCCWEFWARSPRY